MPAYGYIIVAAGSLIWFLPMFLQLRKGRPAQQVDRRARWGILLVGIGYALVWQGHFWTRSPGLWRTSLAVACFVVACLFSWSAAHNLGQHWRLDAGLNADHTLVQTGVYRLVRHPVYTSMLMAILGTGLILAPFSLLVAGVTVYMLGTEIRVRIEDGLLASRFGDEFQVYRRSVPAYLPGLRHFRKR